MHDSLPVTSDRKARFRIGLFFLFLFLFLTLSTFFPPLKYGITRKLEDCLGHPTLGGGPSLVLRSVSVVLCRESRTRYRASDERALEPPIFSASE